MIVEGHESRALYYRGTSSSVSWVASYLLNCYMNTKVN